MSAKPIETARTAREAGYLQTAQHWQARAVAAEAGLKQAREWIDTVGRTCPSNATVDAFLAALSSSGGEQTDG